MKYILSIFGIAIIVCACVFFTENNHEVNEDYLRIHITANSNSQRDQNIKYVVKDAVVEFLIPKLADAENKTEAENIIKENLNKIEDVANVVLEIEGVNYFADVSIVEEEMPARAYDNLVLEAGVYQSLNIKLGESRGDNWWCVVFPAVCFLDSKNFGNLEYISKIWDIINRVTS